MMGHPRYERSGSWGRLKVLAGVVTAAFAVTLALVVGNRLSAEALGVLAGAVCGVGAAIPTSLLVVAVSRRRDGAEGPSPWRTSRHHQDDRAYPPVIVVSPQGGSRGAHPGWDTLRPFLSAPAERRFTVVGGRSLDREEMHYGDECRS